MVCIGGFGNWNLCFGLRTPLARLGFPLPGTSSARVRLAPVLQIMRIEFVKDGKACLAQTIPVSRSECWIKMTSKHIMFIRIPSWVDPLVRFVLFISLRHGVAAGPPKREKPGGALPERAETGGIAYPNARMRHGQRQEPDLRLTPLKNRGSH